MLSPAKLTSDSLKLASFTHIKSKSCIFLADKFSTKTLIIDVEGALLRTTCTFAYFMLVALEAGGFLRGLVLLMLYPLIICLSEKMAIELMVMISFCGLSQKSFLAGRAVLPKFFMEDVGEEGFEMMRGGKRRVCVSRMPRVMVECFLKEYLEVEVAVGRELKVFRGYYTGFMEEDEINAQKVTEEDSCFAAVLSSNKSFQHQLFSCCKEIYLVTEAEKKKWHPLPREKYPRLLIFHNGRLAFRPSPLNTAGMFLWLPFSIPLAILRLIIGLSLPYNVSSQFLAFLATKWRLKGFPPPTSYFKKSSNKGHLFICNHRTLLDPLYIAIALNMPVTAVTYSLSRVSELISPIKTVRLTRTRERDRGEMEKLLHQGRSLVVCPEGTTCREPYLLRFSPLFAELTYEIIPVAIDVRVSMFYASTAGGFKGFDFLYYLMNPTMCYELEFLDRIDMGGVLSGECSSIQMANRVQREIGKTLGFECTMLTRKDKYMMLVGNNGIVA